MPASAGATRFESDSLLSRSRGVLPVLEHPHMPGLPGALRRDRPGDVHRVPPRLEVSRCDGLGWTAGSTS